ncbi:MAG: glycoside hydrolase family 3 C-terminal domain-containing protein [Tidjanibacter sp.]|nr:glycoside hydrolase family 3 C-terminal domain-containing protein [Tidjanibacter sp.]MBR6813000.1 glycoside hydrolase family 3 C-terminal domain-containing protein [Tidjanibacter sp.]
MKKIFSKVLVIGVAALMAACGGQQPKQADLPDYLNPEVDVEARIDDAMSRMTLDEKIAIIHAQSKFSSAGVPRLGIPELWTSDGPHGIRPEVLWDEWEQAGWTNDYCVAFPALTALAATWNTDMSALYGKSIGEEARYREKDVLLGPGVNIYRSPLNGRNFEYMGEDPFLASRMVVPYVQGVQSNGVAACVKHYALNNQESHRHTMSPVLDDRTLYEIYLPAFKAAVQEGGAWAIMGAYNNFRGQQACHNDLLLNQILKGEWGFDGVVISDWGGTHNTREAITNGLDLEFGTWTDGLTMGATNGYDAYFLADPYKKLIESGEFTTKELDEKVRRVLRLMYRTSMNTNKPFGSLVSDEHVAASRTIGEEGIVLLKNDNNVLPIDLNKTKTIAVIGENAIKAMTVGGGSSSLKVAKEVSPLEGLQNRVGDKAEILYARGYVGDVNTSYNGVESGQNLVDNRGEDVLIAEAVEAARRADVVIMFGGLNKASHQDCEDSDRYGLELPYAQDKLMAALVEANRNVVYVNISGNAVAMPWVNSVPAIVQGWFLGSEAGNALASVLMGDVNPSGKLPFTFPVKLTDTGAHSMGEFGGRGEVVYGEGLLVGYRWNDAKDVAPLFAFGHGLSYTTFAYGDVTIDKTSMNKKGSVTVTVPVTNTGNRAGKEVVQLYISDKEASVMRPEKELKGFAKVELEPGQTKEVSFVIDAEALSFFDDKKHEWVAEQGEFEALVGAASDDIKGGVSFTLK